MWKIILDAPFDCPYYRNFGEDKGTCGLNDGVETEEEWQCNEVNCPIKFD